MGRAAIAAALAGVLGACSSSASIRKCVPEEACSCDTGVQRATRCTCAGGSSCSIDGDNIEFQCDGNAACGLTCGTDCLITCPGTTSCSVDVDSGGVVSCPGTATCDITCRGNCTVDVAGAARAVVRCLGSSAGATCTITGCAPSDCGNGVSACRSPCPP